MPATHGAGSPNQQLYSLFPKKKKSSKKNDQLEDGEKRSSFSQRRIEGGMADKVSDWRAAPRPDSGPPQIREGEKTVPKSEAKNLQAWEGGSKSSTGRAMSSAGVQVNRESRGTRPSMSFAEMAKRGGGGRDIKEKSSRNVSKGEVETSERGSRQTGPCLSQVVLNQISASTYGKIGKSADESKYVMGGRGQEVEGKPTWTNELEVEFREEEMGEVIRGKRTEDFEVEFSSAAPGPRSRMSTVNKISANTFQQIGKSRTEGYVMQPAKSWSAVVGGPKKKYGTAATEAKAARENEVSEDNCSKGAPTEYDRIRLKLKEGKEELTETEREALRVKRRERRKREKENKKKEKEEEKRTQMLAPQTSKLHMVTRATLAQMLSPMAEPSRRTGQLKGEKGIKFEDEEYPDLSSRPTGRNEKVISKEIRDEKGRLCQDRESNSEWETEEEKEDEEERLAEAEEETLDIGVAISVVSDSGPLTYSSILKAKKTESKPRGVIIPTDDVKKEMKLERNEVKEEAAAEKKKVRKKDPIEFDLFSALNTKTKQSQAQKKGSSGQGGQVLGGKVKKDQTTPKLVRNQLDSSAPTKKRGKEREGGKKKKRTLLKKIILAERLRKKTARDEAEKRREDRIKEGIFLKPLKVSDDEPDEFIELVQRFDALKTDPQDQSKDGPAPLEHEVMNLEEPRKDESEEKFEVKPNLEDRAKACIHSRKFRTYCNQILSPELDVLIGSLMADLTRFQDNQHAKDPVKAKARRRYAVGLREALKFMKVHKVSSLLLAPDLEAVEARGGLDDTVGALIKESSKQGQEVPVIFGMNRRKLGRACLRKVPVSCVAIMNPQGSDETYKSLLNLATELRQQYKERLDKEVKKLAAEDSGISLKSAEVKSSTSLDVSGGEPPVSRASSVLSLQAPEFVPSWERTGYQYYEENGEVRSVDHQSEEAEVQYQFPPGCYQPLHLPPWQPYSWNRGHKW